MVVRDCCFCEGLFNVNQIHFVRDLFNDSGGFLTVCDECFSLRLAIHQKKISLLVDNVN